MINFIYKKTLNYEQWTYIDNICSVENPRVLSVVGRRMFMYDEVIVFHVLPAVAYLLAVMYISTGMNENRILYQVENAARWRFLRLLVTPFSFFRRTSTVIF